MLYISRQFRQSGMRSKASRSSEENRGLTLNKRRAARARISFVYALKKKALESGIIQRSFEIRAYVYIYFPRDVQEHGFPAGFLASCLIERFDEDKIHILNDL